MLLSSFDFPSSPAPNGTQRKPVGTHRDPNRTLKEHSKDLNFQTFQDHRMTRNRMNRMYLYLQPLNPRAAKSSFRVPPAPSAPKRQHPHA